MKKVLALTYATYIEEFEGDSPLIFSSMSANAILIAVIPVLNGYAPFPRSVTGLSIHRMHVMW